MALLVYFWRDWVRLVPAGLATLRDRSFADDPDRSLAWLLAATTVPAIVAGLLFNDMIETAVRQPGLVAVMLLDRSGDPLGSPTAGAARTRTIAGVTFPIALGIGAAQAVALVPGISRSGISISAGRFAGLDRPAAARFSFLMATPIIAMAGAYETLQAHPRRERRRHPSWCRSSSGCWRRWSAAWLAIHFLLRWLADALAGDLRLAIARAGGDRRRLAS